MAEETTVTTNAPGTSVTTEGAPKGTGEIVLYKLDRSLAILGIIAIAITAIFQYDGTVGAQIVTGACGGLVGYLGGRTSGK